MNKDLHKMLKRSIHRNNKGKANMDDIDVNAIAKEIFPDHTPQMAKDQLKRKLYGESINGRGYEYEKWADEHNGNVAESRNMNKKLIRLTESDIHRIVKESVNRLLSEMDLTNTQIRNMTGISDDDELNAACIAEDADELESNIVKDLRDKYGFYNVYDKGVVLDFNFIKELLKHKYGMNYLGFDEEDDSHLFGNNDFVVQIWSKENYPRLAQFHLQNMHVYHK